MEKTHLENRTLRLVESHLHNPAVFADLSTSVFYVVANCVGCDPTEVQLELEDALDLNALNSLFDSANSDSHSFTITFDYRDFQIQCTSNGRISIFERGG